MPKDNVNSWNEETDLVNKSEGYLQVQNNSNSAMFWCMTSCRHSRQIIYMLKCALYTKCYTSRSPSDNAPEHVVWAWAFLTKNSIRYNALMIITWPEYPVIQTVPKMAEMWLTRHLEPQPSPPWCEPHIICRPWVKWGNWNFRIFKVWWNVQYWNFV